MKVKAIKRFTDLKEKKIREVGDVFEVTKERLDELNKTHPFHLVEEVKINKNTKKVVKD